MLFPKSELSRKQTKPWSFFGRKPQPSYSLFQITSKLLVEQVHLFRLWTRTWSFISAVIMHTYLCGLQQWFANQMKPATIVAAGFVPMKNWLLKRLSFQYQTFRIITIITCIRARSSRTPHELKDSLELVPLPKAYFIAHSIVCTIYCVCNC